MLDTGKHHGQVQRLIAETRAACRLGLVLKRGSMCLAFASLAVACSGDEGQAERFKSSLEVGIDRMEGVDLWYYQANRQKARLRANRMTWNRFQERMDMSGGLEVDFYEGQQGVKVSRLKAKEGTRDLKKGLLEARGQVVANNLAGDTLYAETLRMDEGSGRVSSTGAVRIRTPREWLVGEGLEANRDLSEYRILRLKGTLKLKS